MKNFLRWGLIGGAVIWAAIIGTMFGYIWNVRHAVKSVPKVEIQEIQNTNLSVETQEKMKGYWTVALFGVDSREGDLGKGTRSDMQMILNINLDTGDIRVVSVYRDTYLKIGEKDKYDKINQAYFFGGPVRAVESLNNNLDLSIDSYVSFTWKSVADAINLLGGIDVDISEAEFKVINGFITETVKSTGVGSHHLKKAGLNHLDGVQAVAYARLRKMDTDFKRTERQREVADLALAKAREADLSTLIQMVSAVLPQTSTNITIKDLFPLIKNVKMFHLSAAAGFPFDLRDAMVGKKDCVIPTNMADNVKKLHQFLFDEEDYEPSDEVKEVSRQIELHSKNKTNKK